jgi:hypothetical protein
MSILFFDQPLHRIVNNGDPIISFQRKNIINVQAVLGAGWASPSEGVYTSDGSVGDLEFILPAGTLADGALYQVGFSTFGIYVAGLGVALGSTTVQGSAADDKGHTFKVNAGIVDDSLRLRVPILNDFVGSVAAITLFRL